MKSERKRFFYSRVQKSDGCWLWTGTKTTCGYGRIYIDGELRMAHRISWSIDNDREVPEGLLVLHTCDVKSCVRPEHLYVGDMSDNMNDMWTRKRRSRDSLTPLYKHNEMLRARTHCPRGHAYGPARHHPTMGDRYRRCLVCKYAYMKAYKQRMRAGVNAHGAAE